MRVAFNGSGISKNNRVLERHDAVHGYYWRTYDFEEVPQALLDRWDYREIESRQATLADRSSIYGGVHLYVLRD